MSRRQRDNATVRQCGDSVFWEQVEQRMGENREIVKGGLPGGWAGIMAWVGLRFWQVSLPLSFGVSLVLWMTIRIEILRLVRWMVWR